MLHANTFTNCRSKKWHLLVVIIKNIGQSRLLPIQLYPKQLPRSWERLKFCLRFVKSHFCLFSARYFFILSAPLLTPFNSDMLSLRKFTINWRLQSKWQSMWQSKWLSLSLHLQMNNEYLNILHNIIFYQDVTVWHLLTVFGVTVWHLHKLWHGYGTF